ncbi:MAG: DUF2231 domain-containing protein [Akkermansiaceae bacterium]|nr:DUF2231 domain-containing protein [Verrucomicrobiales bacterium]
MNFPPLHPALVHLPIAFVILSVVADFSARISKSEPRRAILRTLGFWSLVAALIGGVLTIAAGYLDLNRATLTPETFQLVRLHLIGGWTLGILLALLTAWRWLIWHRGQMTINTSYLAGGFLVLTLTLFQGWYGSELVYAYGAGVAPAGQGTETAEAAQSRLIAIHNALQPGNAIGGADSPGGTNSASASTRSTALDE